MIRNLAAAGIVIFLASLQAAAESSENAPPAEVSSELQNRALQELQSILRNESGLAKIQAAESLIALGYSEDVSTNSLDDFDHLLHDPQYKSATLRMLGQVLSPRTPPTTWTAQLAEEYLKSDNIANQAQAAEALAKLNYQIPEERRAEFEKVAESFPPESLPYARWLLAESGSEIDLRKLADLLNAENSQCRAAAAYALRHLYNSLPPDIVKEITDLVNSE